MRKRVSAGSVLGIPYLLFQILFIVVPLLVIVYYAFTDGQGQFSAENFLHLFYQRQGGGNAGLQLCHRGGVHRGLPADCLPHCPGTGEGRLPERPGAADAVCDAHVDQFLPLRLTALKEILTVLEGNLAYYPFLNTIIGMTYDFLPFMILPIYNTIVKIDTSYVEAAMDLGRSGERYCSVCFCLCPCLVSSAV